MRISKKDMEKLLVLLNFDGLVSDDGCSCSPEHSMECDGYGDNCYPYTKGKENICSLINKIKNFGS